ncbi:hypothetical protein G6F46_003798 [Rhizopus delemar]|nr:hypothetical protein G6F46_003798 [Rhizopus delemar]
MSSVRSTEELERLSNISVDHNTPVKLYFRSAELLLKQARVYKLEDDLEHAYILYMKYTNLGLNELPKHPAYRKVENKKNIKSLNKNCLEALEALEYLKPQLDEKYLNYKKEQQHQQVKVTKTPQTETMQHALRPLSVDSLDNHMKEWNLQEALEGVAGVGYSEAAIDQSLYNPSQKTNYPDLLLLNQSDKYNYQATYRSHLPTSAQTPSPPKLPPKISAQQSNYPVIPPKIPLSADVPKLPPKIKISSGPTVDASSERGEPLRQMILPEFLQRKFLSIAEPNTRNKIETCGILAGKLKNNTLNITTLIIPKQKGTPDTCTTENEEELFDIQDKHDLLTFGWIHTHPTQSCFLSSVDLHTHCSYQLMLPEAIAIVCSPSQSPDFGIFRLTDPPGLDIISNCKKQPAFHPHPDLPIYTDVVNDGHVKVLDYDFNVLDLRK